MTKKEIILVIGYEGTGHHLVSEYLLDGTFPIKRKQGRDEKLMIIYILKNYITNNKTILELVNIDNLKIDRENFINSYKKLKEPLIINFSFPCFGIKNGRIERNENYTLDFFKLYESLNNFFTFKILFLKRDPYDTIKSILRRNFVENINQAEKSYNIQMKKLNKIFQFTKKNNIPYDILDYNNFDINVLDKVFSKMEKNKDFSFKKSKNLIDYEF